MKKTMRILCTSILIVFCIMIFPSIWVYFNYKPADYNRAIYTIVFYNQTDESITDIEILLGGKEALYDKIARINSGEYYKVNIDTNISYTDQNIVSPYNIIVRYYDGSAKQRLSVDHFGIQTGGFSLINIAKSDEKLIFRLSSTGLNYYIQRSRNYKNQNEDSWY